MSIDEIDNLTNDLYMEWLDSGRSEPRDLRREIFLAGHAIASSGLAACAFSAHEWRARAERAENFARVVTGLRGSMSKSEVSLLVETAQITLLFPSEKAGGK